MNWLDETIGTCLVCRELTMHYDQDLELFVCKGDCYRKVLQAYGYDWTH